MFQKCENYWTSLLCLESPQISTLPGIGVIICEILKFVKT